MSEAQPERGCKCPNIQDEVDGIDDCLECEDDGPDGKKHAGWRYV